MSDAPAPPVLEAVDARLLVDGVVTFAALSFETQGDRAVLAGDYGPVLRTLLLGAGPSTSAGSATVVGGRLALLGRDVASGAHLRTQGVALVDPPLPEDFTAESYLVWSGRLAGLTASEARERARERLEALTGVASSGQRALRSLGLVARRLLGLAAATLTAPPVVVLEDPLAGLDEHGAALVSNAVEVACRGCAVLLCLPRVDLHGPAATLLRSATSLSLLREGRLAFHGRIDGLLAGARLFAVTVEGDGVGFEAALRALGVDVQGGPVHFAVTLPEGVGPKAIVAAAARLEVALLGCIPVV